MEENLRAALARRRPVIVAHRGASGAAPENTLAAFRRALELGVPMLELDVHRSADGTIVVLHDATVDRTTDGSGAVAQMTLNEIRRLDAGVKKGPQFAGERIPTLAEVCALARGRAFLFVEVKAEGIADDVLRVLDEGGMTPYSIPISFSAANVRRL
ncbi:MAG: glycerophosphodiester phosphodiesterase family protein, partial [Armatimonadota bacterium]|nr:glycerophosphodiester phosphodiesterase family protein [Armatimonadota bacterium]